MTRLDKTPQLILASSQTETLARISKWLIKEEKLSGLWHLTSDLCKNWKKVILLNIFTFKTEYIN